MLPVKCGSRSKVLFVRKLWASFECLISRPNSRPPLWGLNEIKLLNQRIVCSFGADQGAAVQVDDVDISSGNQTQCSQRFLARDGERPVASGARRVSARPSIPARPGTSG
jgi:hypothetical protein